MIGESADAARDRAAQVAIDAIRDEQARQAGRLTRHQSAVIGAYTGIVCGPFSAVQEYAESVLGRPVWTHEFGTREVADALKDAARADFLDLCNEDV